MGRDDAADRAPAGWAAIDAALTARYGIQVPRHVAYLPPMAFSENLQGCSAYAADGHWHYVSYGLSDLFDTSDRVADPALRVSGRGLELTLRVRRGPERTPPGWAFWVLNELARQVNRTGAAFLPADRFDMASPITGHPHQPDAPPTELTAWVFTVDPELGTIRTSNGRVQFLQAVGVTVQERARMAAGSPAEVLGGLAAASPLLVTDPGRAPAH